jgi:hypothetical protein
MSSDAFGYVDVSAAAALAALGRAAAPRGKWLCLEGLEEEAAGPLSEKLDVPVVHCVVQTSSDLAWVRAFSKGRIVRELQVAAEGLFTAHGPALPFEDTAALNQLRGRVRGGRSVDPYEVLDAFLGLPPPPPPPPRKKPVIPRRKARSGVVTMPGPSADTPDEDRFKPPASWAIAIDPRRGGWFSEKPIAIDVDDAFQKLRDARGELRFRDAAPAVRARFDAASPTRLTLEEEAETAIHLRIWFDRLVDHRPPDSPLPPLWVGLGGLEFAIDCVLTSLELDRGQRTPGPGLAVLRGVRRLIAAASEEDYQRARARTARPAGRPSRTCPTSARASRTRGCAS